MKRLWQHGDPIYCPHCESRMKDCIKQTPSSIDDHLNDKVVTDVVCTGCGFKTTRTEQY